MVPSQYDMTICMVKDQHILALHTVEKFLEPEQLTHIRISLKQQDVLHHCVSTLKSPYNIRNQKATDYESKEEPVIFVIADGELVHEEICPRSFDQTTSQLFKNVFFAPKQK